MDSIYFIPTTKYHIIISYILRSSFPEIQKKIIVIPKSIDPKYKIFKSLILHSSWDKVIKIDDTILSPNTNDLYNKISNLLFLKRKISQFVYKHSMRNIVMFSPGNMVVNTISNHKYIKNIYMGEDGIMPYFNQKYYYKNYNLNTSYYKQILIKVFYNFTRFDLKRRLKQILILAPKYYIKDTDENIIIKEANYSNDIMKNCFNDLSKTFNYKNDITYKDAQILYFDSDLSRLGYISAKDEVKIIASVLSIFKDNKIVIKPHQHIDNEKLALLRELVVNNNNINIDEQNYEIPWEIIYFNNMDSLKRSINLTFLSSIIISSDVLFNKINKNILLHKIIVNEKINHAQVQDKIHLFINKIKSIHNNDKKNLLEPLNLLELKNNFHKKHLL